jgi:hypothetical protein
LKSLSSLPHIKMKSADSTSSRTAGLGGRQQTGSQFCVHLEPDKRENKGSQRVGSDVRSSVLRVLFVQRGSVGQG